MNTDKQKMDWYPKEFMRIVNEVIRRLEKDPETKALVIRAVDPSTAHRSGGDPAPWEEWLREVNAEAFFMLKRLRFLANDIWASGTDAEAGRERFTVAVETEYNLSIWAARQFSKTATGRERR